MIPGPLAASDARGSLRALRRLAAAPTDALDRKGLPWCISHGKPMQPAIGHEFAVAQKYCCRGILDEMPLIGLGGGAQIHGDGWAPVGTYRGCPVGPSW